ncbi:MAG: hypothetical protein ABW221_23515 [Vicinamibacteria bacterium]
MSAEAEDLAELSEALPHLPDEINALGKAAHDLQQGVHHLLDRVAEARQEVSVLSIHARQTVPAFTAAAESLSSGLANALQGAEEAWTQARELLDEGEQALSTASTHVDDARATLSEVLSETKDRIDHALEGGEAAIDRVESVARGGAERVRAAGESASAAAGRFRELVAKARSEVIDAAEALLERIGLFKDAALFDSNTLIEHVLQRANDYADHLEEVVQALPGQTDSLVSRFGTRVDDEMAEALLRAGTLFRLELEGLAASADPAALADTRDALAQSVDELEAAAQPLPAAMQDIQSAMERLSQP